MKWSWPTQDRDADGETWWTTWADGGREAKFTHEDDASDFVDYMNETA